MHEVNVIPRATVIIWEWREGSRLLNWSGESEEEWFKSNRIPLNCCCGYGLIHLHLSSNGKIQHCLVQIALFVLGEKQQTANPSFCSSNSTCIYHLAEDIWVKAVQIMTWFIAKMFSCWTELTKEIYIQLLTINRDTNQSFITTEFCREKVLVSVTSRIEYSVSQIMEDLWQWEKKQQGDGGVENDIVV